MSRNFPRLIIKNFPINWVPASI